MCACLSGPARSGAVILATDFKNNPNEPDRRGDQMFKRILAFSVLLGGLSACDQSGVFDPNDDDAVLVAKTDQAGSGALTVMTRNVYIGARIENVLEAPAELIPCAVYQEWQTVQANDFNERAEILADEIVGATPHLVGLQEMTLFRTQSPGDFFWPPAYQQPATDVRMDFVQILLDALEAKGMHYVVAAQIQNFDIEVPATQGACDPYPPSDVFDDVRVTDFDVILAREDVQISNPKSGNYAAVLAPVFELPGGLPPLEIPLHRGWASIDATVKGVTYRFVDTHFEDDQIAPIFQQLQAQELLTQVLTDLDTPTILVGDLNTAADGSTTPTYGQVIDAGFVDLWTIGRQRGDGFTCCTGSDLIDPQDDLDRRFDLVLYRDAVTAGGGSFRGSVHAEVVGDDRSVRTNSGLLPSDHAGTVVTLNRASGSGSL